MLSSPTPSLPCVLPANSLPSIFTVSSPADNTASSANQGMEPPCYIPIHGIFLSKCSYLNLVAYYSPMTNVTVAAMCVGDPSDAVCYRSPSLVSLTFSAPPPSPSAMSRSEPCAGNKAINMSVLANYYITQQQAVLRFYFIQHTGCHTFFAMNKNGE